MTNRGDFLHVCRLGICAIAWSMICMNAWAQQIRTPEPQKAKIVWKVQVPSDTPADARLYIAGNQECFGPWQPDVFELQRLSDGLYQASAQMEIGTRIEYKITRGSWSTVEKGSGGSEIRNRTLIVTAPQTVEIQVANWAIPKPPPASSASGDLRWIDFDSQLLGSKRRITVWLPPQYRADLQSHFPVVYLLDGQNVFDNQRAAFGIEWRADETAKEFAQRPDPKPLILVAIDNSKDRFDEYTPVADVISGNTVGGKADAYLQFVANELKPWVDKQYRTDRSPESTAIVGSSLGGLFVLNALHKRPDVFTRGAAMSPSLFWGNAHALDVFSKPLEPGPTNSKQRLWIDMGTLEGKSLQGQTQAIEQAKELTTLIQQQQPQRFDVGFLIDQDAKHNETAWAKRLPTALEFLFPTPVPTPDP